MAPLCREFVTRFLAHTVGTLPDLGRFLAATHGCAPSSPRSLPLAAMSMSPMFPLYALSLPTLLIASATVSLHQFKLCFVAFVKVANTSRGNAVWQTVQPVLRDVAFVMENTLGKASSFSPNLTHVLLTSLVLAVVFSAERLRSAIAQTRR